VYAALILHDEGLEITPEAISKILKASKVECEAYWPTLFAKLCKGKDMNSLIMAVATYNGRAHTHGCCRPRPRTGAFGCHLRRK